jgi:anti-sigma factor RsiW
MFKHDPTDTKPCLHMRHWVSALADGALTGFARWYTERHVGNCPQCRKGLATILSVRDRLRALIPGQTTSLSQERWNAIEAAWEQADRERAQIAP